MGGSIVGMRDVRLCEGISVRWKGNMIMKDGKFVKD